MQAITLSMTPVAPASVPVLPPSIPVAPASVPVVPASVDLNATIPDDGSVTLRWSLQTGRAPEAWRVLAIRTGSRPGYTSVRLDAAVGEYQFKHLSRHQRYRFLVMAESAIPVCSAWLVATPKDGLASTLDDDVTGVTGSLAAVRTLMVMPQDRRLTAYWQLTRGFVDRVIVEVLRGTQLVTSLELEPEVTSVAIDAQRLAAIRNGEAYTIRISTSFCREQSELKSVIATPAPQGQERLLNRVHPQGGLVYACLSLTDELDVFGERGAGNVTTAIIKCAHCQSPAEWKDYALRCTGCRAEFISNGRGDFLDVTRLRFGTCRCCMPKKILIQDVGSQSLRCAHSGKEYVKLGQEFLLTEDLPFGLCQCCRPRRPLNRHTDGNIRCTRSNEIHRRSDGDASMFMLVPSAPVFDAAAIDELLDAGLADICASGVSRARRS